VKVLRILPDSVIWYKVVSLVSQWKYNNVEIRHNITAPQYATFVGCMNWADCQKAHN